MKCPYCGSDSTRVLDSRTAEDGLSIRRRRICETCGQRFTSYEKVEEMPVVVIKKNGTRQEFNHQKLVERLMRAFVKRKVTVDELDAIADDIEREASHMPKREITTKEIGDEVLKRLWKIDQVAYVRFASVYRDFENLDSFIEVINEMREKDRQEKGTEKEGR